MKREASRQADPTAEIVAAGLVRDRNARPWTAVEKYKLRGLMAEVSQQTESRELCGAP